MGFIRNKLLYKSNQGKRVSAGDRERLNIPSRLSYCGITEKQYAKESSKPLYNLTMCKGNDQFSLRDNERFEIASSSYCITAEQFAKEMGLIQ